MCVVAENLHRALGVWTDTGCGQLCDAAVRELQSRYRESLRILVGVEFDFFPGHEARIAVECREYGFDYALGAVHFLSEWGFDFAATDWQGMSQRGLFELYERYFEIVAQMAASGLFQIAAHLDLVKIFSKDAFAAWVAAGRGGCADRLFERCLEAMADFNMALEVSTAGLRKPCREIYPCPRVMELASKKGIPVALASDSHTVGQVGYAFDQLFAYLRAFGYDSSVYFQQGVMTPLSLR
jgi:histidinol-phosphatase (PHP family)